MIPENPEVAMANAAQKSLNALALELPESVYEDVKAKFQPLINAARAFNDRHVVHQFEQRESARRLAAVIDRYEHLIVEHHAAREMIVGDNCPICA